MPLVDSQNIVPSPIPTTNNQDYMANSIPD